MIGVLRCAAGLMIAAAVGFESSAAEFEVSAAAPTTIVWTVPVKASAGEQFTVKLEVRDRFGNIVKDFDRRGTGFELKVNGRGEINPKSILPQAFQDGVAEIHALYTVAERIELVARAVPAASSMRAEGIAAGIEFKGPPFHVAAGKLTEIRVVAPVSARAGTPFRVTLMALDAYGNTLKDFRERTTGVILSTNGFGLLNPMRVMPAAFNDGMAEITVTYTGAGLIDILAKEPGAEVTGRSGTKVLVGPGEPVKFQVTAPKTGMVDEAFDVAITALDAFGNVVTDYDVVGTLVVIGTDGSASIPNNQMPADKFSKGVAFLKLTYSKPENIMLIVSEPGTSRTGTSAPISIEPGRASQLDLVAPARAEAGKAFSVKIRATDARGNPSKFTPSRVILYVHGSIITTPMELTEAAFKNGEAERKISYNIAEEISLTAQDATGSLKSDPVRVQVKPGPAVAMGITAPNVVTAGAGISVKLTAMDEFRNVVESFDKTSDACVVRVDGPNAPPGTEVSSEAFINGQTEVGLNYFMAGSVRVSAELHGKRASSGAIEILPAALHHFDVDPPAHARAGEAFRLNIRARDAYGNLVLDYDRIGGGIQIHTSGISEVQPSLVPPATFKKGAAQVDIVTYAAEVIVLTVAERFGSAGGQSGQIHVSAGTLDHFLVSASPKVRAGENFPLRIEAQDMYYNLIKNFNITGPIRLSSSGPGMAQPPQIDPSQFSNGVALIQASITTAGRAELVVSTDDRKASGRSNPIAVMPAAASSYRVDVLEAVTAGEPFRVRISALDSFGNPVEDMKAISRALRLGSGGSRNDITPSAVSPDLFRQGVAEAYMVVPQAGRISVQVSEKPGDRAGWSSDGMSRVEGLYFKTYGSDRTDIYLIATGPLEYRVSQPAHYGDGLDALVVTLPNAGLMREINYDSLDLPGLRAAKLGAHATTDAPATPRLILKMDSRYAYSVNSRANLLVLSLSQATREMAPTFSMPVSGTPASVMIPSIEEIHAMVNRGDYKTARRAVELFLSAHPGHPEAGALKARLEKVMRLLGE